MRRDDAGYAAEQTMVSIHASVKDATCFVPVTGRRKRFNPRICKRCDTMYLVI